MIKEVNEWLNNNIYFSCHYFNYKNKNMSINSVDNMKIINEIVSTLVDVFKIDIETSKNFMKSYVELNKIKLNDSDFYYLYDSHRDLKQNQRFLLNFPKEFGIPNYTVSSVTKPQISEIKTYFGLKTKINFSDLIVKLYDPILNSNSGKLFKILNTNEKFDVTLEELNPMNEVVESWIYKDCSFKTINFGTLNYSDNNLNEIVTTINVSDIEVTTV